MRRLLLLCLCLLTILTACAPKKKTAVPIFFAGSLIFPFQELEQAYEAQHPDVDLLMEGHGSIQVIRHVTEIHELIDVVVTADHALIPMLMYSATVPETQRPYADWYFKFATNSLALAYRPDSRYADEITSENWYEIISRPDVKLGMADPRFDASGYRALMVVQMAEKLYGQPTLFEDLITGNFRSGMTARLEGARLVIRVPEIVELKDNSSLVVRAYSIQLVALLESGDLDYAFEYESVIKQHGLKSISLPAELSLGVEDMAERYGQVAVRMDFQRFASVQPVFIGEPIGYGVTIPTNAPHPKEAADFVAFLLGPEGQKILTDNYQPIIVPAQADNYQQVPQALRSLCQPMPSLTTTNGSR
jgi:molybdate/tungstate transport system substrate-binding protein